MIARWPSWPIAALDERATTGLGEHIDVGMLKAMVAADVRTLWRRLSTSADLRDRVAPDASPEARFAGRAEQMGAWMLSFDERGHLLAAPTDTEIERLVTEVTSPGG